MEYPITVLSKFTYEEYKWLNRALRKRIYVVVALLYAAMLVNLLRLVLQGNSGLPYSGPGAQWVAIMVFFGLLLLFVELPIYSRKRYEMVFRLTPDGQRVSFYEDAVVLEGSSEGYEAQVRIAYGRVFSAQTLDRFLLLYHSAGRLLCQVNLRDLPEERFRHLGRLMEEKVRYHSTRARKGKEDQDDTGKGE